jgi:hypothetical protein
MSRYDILSDQVEEHRKVLQEAWDELDKEIAALEVNISRLALSTVAVCKAIRQFGKHMERDQ